jgi:RNA polymerase sigma-70 factor (ECF subfamily)
MTSDRQAELDALFDRLFTGFQRPILNYLYRLLGDRDRAEEVAQDVFVKAYRALPRLPADANHRAWLYRIATNAAYDQLRRRKVIQWLPMGDRERTVAGSTSPEPGLGEREAVQQALEQLPPKYRTALILFCVQGYSTQEIGDMLGISVGAVKTRLYRAREMFRESYGEDI